MIILTQRLNSSIRPTGVTKRITIALDWSGTKSNRNEGVIHIPQTP